jgi:hypothetical protein
MATVTINIDRAPTKEIELKLGILAITPRAKELFVDNHKELALCIARHISGDWGEVDNEDWDTNDAAAESGMRVLSAYTVHGSPQGPTKIWIITEGNRSYTTILLPEDY